MSMFENPSPAIHRGAIDKTTITSQPPQRVMEGMVTLLRDMEVLIEEESSFKYTCVKSQSIGSSVNRQPGDEVRFTVELTRLDGLSEVYSLDIRRLRGDLMSYKNIYDCIRERAVSILHDSNRIL